MTDGRSTIWWELRWPPEIKVEQILAALLACNGLSSPLRRSAVVLEAVGSDDVVEHRIGVSEQRAEAIRQQLQTALPGLAMDEIAAAVAPADRAWRAWISTKRRPLAIDHPEVISSAILTALVGVAANERLVARWTLGPVRRPMAVGSHAGSNQDRFFRRLLTAPFEPPQMLDNEARTALRDKQGVPGWRADLVIGVQAHGRPRQLQLLGRLAGAYRMAQASGVEIGFRPTSVRRFGGRIPIYWPLAVNVLELRGLAGLPIGATAEQPVRKLQSRPLPPPKGLATTGLVVGEATFPGQERPLALSLRDATSHILAIGPTGVGKTVLLQHLLIAQLEAGCGVAVVEPADLINNVLASMPEHRLNDVVVVDATDEAPVGINPLAQRGVSPDVIADQVLAVFKGLFGEAIGPRTQDLLTAGVLTLAHSPNTSLVALPRLFANARYRAQLLARTRDPIALDPFWQWWDALSVAESNAVLAPLMNKLRAYLLREKVRRIIGNPKPFDVAEVFTKRRALFVSLPTGDLGAMSSALIGSTVVAMLWQAAQARVRIPPEHRREVFITIDEVQRFLNIPTDIGDALATSRGLKVGWILAHQHLQQLPGNTRASIQANARSKIVFRVNHDDARAFAQEDPRMSIADFTGLGRFEAYASLVSKGEVTPFASIHTLPPPPVLRRAEDVRQLSRQRWGVPVAEIDAALVAIDGEPSHPTRKAPSSTFGVIDRSQPSGPDEEGRS